MDTGGKSPLLVVAVSFLLGSLGALAHIAYSFLPALNAADVVVFGAIGFVLASLYPKRIALSLAIAAIPALIEIGFITARIGTSALEQGVGVGHVYSFVTIPLGLALGAILARRFSARRVPRETSGSGV